MKVQEVTKCVIEQLEHDQVSGINPGVVMAVIIAAERCGVINQPCNTQMQIDSAILPVKGYFCTRCKRLLSSESGGQCPRCD